MKLYIKNMVCRRCKMVVGSVLKNAGMRPLSVDLGEVETEGKPDREQLDALSASLKQFGFELIADKKSRVIEKIKNEIVKLVHHSNENISVNLSDHLAVSLHYDYGYLSNLFSEVEGTTIEKYFIAQRVEKIKELLVYDELSLSQIADKLGYSSTAYLSAQFKKVTGLTPSFYRAMKVRKRYNIEDL